MAFDFKAFQESLSTSFEMEFYDDIKKEPSGWFIELATDANDAAQSRFREILDARGPSKSKSLAQEEKFGIDLMAARVVGWRGLVDGGKPVEYSHELAVQFLTGARSASLRKQIMEALGDTERPFIQKTPGDS